MSGTLITKQPETHYYNRWLSKTKTHELCARTLTIELRARRLTITIQCKSLWWFALRTINDMPEHELVMEHDQTTILTYLSEKNSQVNYVTDDQNPE